MKTKLIKIDDDILVEVNTNSNEPQQISSRLAEKVDSSLKNLKTLLKKVSNSIYNSWDELGGKNSLEQVEIEIGVSFEAEGNLYIAKTSANANLNIKLVLKSNK